MEDFKDFESALLKKIGGKEVDKTLIKDISTEIATLKKNGLVIDQIYIKGKPRIDRYIINGIVDPEFWIKFKDLGRVFERFEVFPYGILTHQGFRFKASIGRQ